MYAYEIKDFTKKKIRKCNFSTDEYIYMNEIGEWIHSLGFDVYVEHLFLYDNWEEYKEPERITLYRYTYRYVFSDEVTIVESQYTTDSWEQFKLAEHILLKTETKEIEI